MTLKLNGTNSEAAPAYAGDDADTGLQCGTNELKLVTGGSARATVDSSGRLLVGTSSDTTGDTGAKVQIVDTGTPVLALSRNDTSITSGNTIGQIRIFSNDDSGYQECARIAAQADGTFANNDKPTRLVFSTTTDGASSPTERMRVDSSGRLLVGSSSVRGDFYNATSVYPLLQLEKASASAGQQPRLIMVQNSPTGESPELVFAKTRGTNSGSSTRVNSGDELGLVSFQGADGSENVEAARIQAFVDGTPGSNDMPGRLEFKTTADGAISPTERFRIAANGQLQSHSEGNTTMKPMQGCRAFCCFKGTGTVSVFSSFNVASLTDIGTGAYEITFGVAMVDANYGVTSGFQRNAANDEFVNVGYNNTTTKFRVEFFDSGSATDCQRMTVAAFR